MVVQDSNEMRILKEETSAKIATVMKDIVLSEKIDFRVTKLDILSNVVSILSRLLTVAFNIYLALEYYSRGEFHFFKLTLCFILIPAIISIALSVTL